MGKNVNGDFSQMQRNVTCERTPPVALVSFKNSVVVVLGIAKLIDLISHQQTKCAIPTFTRT